MQCPTDGTVLVMSERSGIEIDYCPTCRGVWLDRGELDKIIDRSLEQTPAAPAPHRRPRRRPTSRTGATTTGGTPTPAPPTRATARSARRAGSASSSTDLPSGRGRPTLRAGPRVPIVKTAGMDSEPSEYADVARAETERGELVLRSRRAGSGPEVLELRANGVFVMDTAETSSERALASAALELRGLPRDRAGRWARAGLHDARGARRPARRALHGRRDRAGPGRLDARRHHPPRPGDAGRRAAHRGGQRRAPSRSPRPAR